MSEKEKSLLYRLSCNEDSFFSSVVLLLLKYVQSVKTLFTAGPLDVLVGLASTNHTLAGRAAKRLKRLWKGEERGYLTPAAKTLAWLVLALWCAPSALACVFCLYPFRRKLSGDQCDVCQSVCRKEGFGKLDGMAMNFIRLGLRQGHLNSAHTKGLLQVGYGWVMTRRGKLDDAYAAFENARALADLAETENPGQAARIFRECGEWWRRHRNPGVGMDLLARARRLAAANRAKDQLLKIGTR